MNEVNFLITHTIVRRAIELRIAAGATAQPLAPYIEQAIDETAEFMPQVLTALAARPAP